MISYEVPLIKDPKITEKEVSIKETGMKYQVLKYDEKYVCDNDVKIGLYRSVIYTVEGQLICYSSPKSISLDTFSQIYPKIGDDIFVSEVVEGTMISLFWDDRIGRWEVATTGSVGGNYWFYRTQYENEKERQKTFREMFLDVFRVKDFESEIFSVLPSGNPQIRICYNFVLQHPDNPIVWKIQHPRLVLISVYGICKDTNIAEYVSYDVYKEWKVWKELSGMVDLPTEYNGLETVEEYRQKYCIPYSSNPIPGVMFLNKLTGERACLENPAYAELKELRGNNPNLNYQYLCILRIGKVEDFLTHFPQYKRLFGRFRQQWDSFVTNIHQAYMSYYIKKEGKPISKRFFPLIYKLHHEVYLPSLTQTKLIMKRGVIFKHLLEVPPNTLFYYLYMTEELKTEELKTEELKTEAEAEEDAEELIYNK